MTNVLLEHKSCLPIVSHTRAIKFCNELGFSSRMKITDLTSIFKFKVFYFIFKNLNVFKWLAAIYIILIFNLLNALGFLIITSVYFYNTEKADTTLELTLVLLTTTLVLMEMLSIVVPLCVLLLIPLVTYDTQFQINLILNADLFRLVVRCLYVVLALLVGVILFSNFELVGVVDLLMAKKKTMQGAEKVGQIIAHKWSQIKPPKPPTDSSIPAVESQEEERSAANTRKPSHYDCQASTFRH